MLDRLIDLGIQFISLFQCWVYVDEFERGVILRLGRFHRTVEPGMRWVLPLGIERILTANSKPDPLYLDIQSLETSDGYQCNIQVGIIWRITDIRLFLIENEQTEQMVSMLASGIVSHTVQSSKWTQIRDPGYAASLRPLMNKKVKKRGAAIDEVVIQDFSNGTANRLWIEGVTITSS